MKGIIKKIGVINEDSTYNTIGDAHHVEFEALPIIGDRFYVQEAGRPTWSTSGVQMIKKLDANHYRLETYHSVYELTLVTL